MQQWGRDLITSWNQHDWIGLPERLGAKLAQLIGACADEVIVTDSTSINIFKTVSAALDLRPGRSTIISGIFLLVDHSTWCSVHASMGTTAV